MLRNKQKCLTVLSMLVALAMLLPLGAVSAEEPSELIVRLGANIRFVDPQLCTDTTCSWILRQIMEGLYYYREDGSVEPGGAASYEVSEDGTVYTLALREDAVWSDGEPVTAQHFVDGMVRLLDPATASEYAWLMYIIKGAEEFNSGEGKAEDVGLEAVDDYTLKITLVGPIAYFPSILAFSTTYPIRLDVIEEYGEQAYTSPETFVGNGPYTLVGLDNEVEAVMEKRPTYWNADSVQIERLVMPVLEERATQLALYENDELDVCEPPGDDIPRILEDPVLSEEFHIFSRPGVWYLGINVLREPTNNLLVRKALAAAIDKRTILDKVTNETWREEATSFIPPGIPGYQGKEVGIQYDPDQARAWLEEAGYPADENGNRPDFPLLQVRYNIGGNNTDIMEAILSMWQQELGINVQLTSAQWSVHQNELDECNNPPNTPADCDYNLYRMGWVMDYADPHNMLNEVYHPNSPFQWGGWSNERFNELMELGLTETDQEKRIKYYQEAQKILAEEDCQAIPIFFYDFNFLIKSGLHYEIPPFAAPQFMRWYFE